MPIKKILNNYQTRLTITTVVFLFFGVNFSAAQDVLMQDGSFVRCAPDFFFDTGGEFGSYGSNENFTITFCPPNAGEQVILDFRRFNTQDDSTGTDEMVIYDGDSTAAPEIGRYAGTTSPGNVVATGSTGCLTITFNSNGFGNTLGWQAAIECVVPCQTITPSIDSTVPAFDVATNTVSIIPGQTVDFNGSATFSGFGANATYFWNFGTGATANTQNASHQFINSGLFNVELTVTDDNPLGCSETVNITVQVGDPIVSINNSVFPQSSLSLFDMVRDVLVDGGCAEIEFVADQVFGQPNELQTKSYGYFTRGGTDFPFDSGIVLTTGNAFSGGNTFDNGTIQGTFGNGQPGDTDLENALSINNTNDATFIEFNFIPTSDRVDFSYILASEEYDGSTECMFFDGFAFILTRPDGTTENLAVLPNGDVVNVLNINGTSCAGAPDNSDFFAGYNLGATNYNGRTEVLTASATNLIPNETYVMKLVVADQGDVLFDTAIFIEAGSFNLGGELGDDITLANGSAECGGDSVTLDTRAPNASHTWFFNGVEIIGETSSTLEVTVAGTYSVNVEFAIDCETNDSIVVEFRESPEIIATPIDLSGCSPTGIAVFNLTDNTPIVFGSQDPLEFGLTYHNSQADADTGDNPIPSLDLTSYNGTDGEVIFVRVTDIATETCVETASFVLEVFSIVTSEDVTYSLCDTNADGDDTNGITDFDLTAINNQVLGAQDPTQFSVSYYATENEAITGNNPLPNTITNGAQSVIFARVQNNNSIDCFATSTVTLVVNPLPIITANVDLRQCDADTDGLSEFNLTEANELISTNAANETFTYYATLTDAENATDAISNPLNYPNTDPSANSDILFVRVENSDFCFRVAQLELFVSTSQIPAGFSIPPYEECDDTRVDDNITDGITTFDFSNATPQIVAIFPVGQNITVTYYESTADALAETNAIPDISNHINTASPFNQTITFRVDNNTDNSCQGIGEFQLTTTNPTPRTDTESVDLVLCDDVTIGDLSETFDLTQNEAFIFDGAPSLTAFYFTDYDDALNNITANEITSPSVYNNTNPIETIYVRVLNTITGCFAIVDFDITVNPLPEVIAITPLDACENATDGVFDFDLDSKREEILNGQDPAIFDVTFHLTQLDADNLANPQPNIITNTLNPQEIFVAITNTTTSCSNSTESFFIEVLEGAQINPDGEPLDFEICDGTDNNESAQFDLNALLPEILDGQDENDYTITFHFNENDALAGTPPLPTLYENLVNPQIIYVRVSNNLNPDICFDIEPIPLLVNPVPEFEIDDQYILCNSFNSEGVVPVPPVIDTGLSSTNFDFQWSLNGVLLTSEINPILIPTQGGIYSVEVFDITTSTITRCSTVRETEVIESDIPILIADVTSQAFAGNHVIEATASGNSTYEFSLDNGSWQEDGFFENVSPGEHIVYARDVNGCGIVSNLVLVMDYPLFFTPNGDGRHDSWNIIGIETQPSAKIYIFDRYGKLIKQLSPTSPGWDGTYQGSNLPTDDYWFVVEYIEPSSGEIKQQRAHFTLKR